MSEYGDLKPNPDFALALDLLGDVIAMTVALIREEKSKSSPDVALLKCYEENLEAYDREHARLIQLEDDDIRDAIRRYREILESEYRNRKEN